jgi:hypothetical protein
VLACLAVLSQCKQGVEMLRSDDSMSCIARVWDVLCIFCSCIVRGEGSEAAVAIAHHLLRVKGTAVVVACIANILGTLANIALEQSGCIRVAGLVSPHTILNCLEIERSLWSSSVSEINSSEMSSHPNADILPAMLMCASSSSNSCTIAGQASALLTNICLNKTASSVYCTCVPLLVALDQARKSLNDAGRNRFHSQITKTKYVLLLIPTFLFQLARFFSIRVTRWTGLHFCCNGAHASPCTMHWAGR